MPRKNTTTRKPEATTIDPSLAEFDAMVEGADPELKEALGIVEPKFRARFVAIVERTDAYCMSNLEPLQHEYRRFCRVMGVALCGEGSPMVEGKTGPEGWAAAIVATLGFVNFLSDPETPPVRTMAQVAAGFGVSESSMHAKSKKIREIFDLMQFNPTWTLPSLLERNPLVWMLETRSGVIVDIRSRPREEQVAAFEAGLIPFVPGDVKRDAAGDEAAAVQVEVKRERAPDVLARIGLWGR